MAVEIGQLLDGIVPAFGVLTATAVVTVIRGRREAARKRDKELADIKADAPPEWGRELIDQNRRIIRDLYGSPDTKWGARAEVGFFEEFAQFRDKVADGIERLEHLARNGNH